MSFPNNFMINPVGVTTKKKTNTITIGEMKLPRNIPNLNHSLLKGVKNFELIIPNIKKKIEINKDQSLISFSFKTGHRAIIKKKIKKTNPKFRLEGSLIFVFIFYSIILSSKSKAIISSFHSLFESPELSPSTFSPLISF